MSNVNPYTSPQNPPMEAAFRRNNSDLKTVRIIFAIHLIAVVFCAFLSLIDSQQITLQPAVKYIVGSLLYVLLMPAVFCWIICPIAMFFAASRLTARPIGFRWLVVFADVALSVFQLWVMLPGVQ